MPKALCGTSIAYGDYPNGAGGCLVRFTDAPDRVLLLTAGHVVLPTDAKQNDPIQNLAQPGQRFGTLRTWTSLAGVTTVDAALIWVEPDLVEPSVLGVGPIRGVNLRPETAKALYFCSNGSDMRETKVDRVDYEIPVSVSGPDWIISKTYVGQILCKPAMSSAGDSGAVVLDENGLVVGMIVAGDPSIGDIVTPIGAILEHPGWNGRLEVLTAIPPEARSPFSGASVSLAKTASPVQSASSPAHTLVAPHAAADTGFAALAPRYQALFDACEIRQDHLGAVEWCRKTIVANRTAYQAVTNSTGVPWWFVGIVHGLECSFSFQRHLHNGDPLSAKTVHVPPGRPKTWSPPFKWTTSAVDALTFQGLTSANDWSLARVLYRLEGYNGYGYYGRGINSPYLWSFSNQYEKGKFVADGKYDPDAVSNQVGAAVMLKALVNAGDIDPPN